MLERLNNYHFVRHDVCVREVYDIMVNLAGAVGERERGLRKRRRWEGKGLTGEGVDAGREAILKQAAHP